MARNIRMIGAFSPAAPKRKRVAAYARVSSGKDAMLHSLSAQISYYSDYIQRHPGWEYAGVYADEALTGTKDDRPEFQRLLSDCRSGKIDMIIAKSISRLARNTVTMLEAVRELKALNIDVWFEKENIHSLSGDGELMLTILASFAQEESRSVSENCKWRIRNRFREGETVNLRQMFGYRIKKGKIDIDPMQSEIVRRVYAEYIGGDGCAAISRRLREENAASCRGGKWTPKRVNDILNNEKYAGNALLQKKYVADHLTKKQKWNRGILPKYNVQGSHHGIIDEETFKRAHRRIAENTAISAPQKPNGQYPFSGLIRCPACGKNYKRKTTHGRHYWNCSTNVTYGKAACHTKQIPEDILYNLTADVLALPHFDENVFHVHIKEIYVPEFNHLIFVFHDGHTVERTWQDKSRRDSWDEAAKERACQRQHEYMEKTTWNKPLE